MLLEEDGKKERNGGRKKRERESEQGGRIYLELGSSLLLVCLGKERTWLHITPEPAHGIRVSTHVRVLSYRADWERTVVERRELGEIKGNV